MNLYTYCNNDPVNNIDSSGYKVETLLMYQSWQYYHFNGYKSGKKDTRIDYSKKQLKAAVKEWKKGKQKNKVKALQYLGYGLHAIQDIEAHGQIGRGLPIPQHIYKGKGNPNEDDVADDINYVWKDEKEMIVLVYRGNGNPRTRLNDTRQATIDYLTEFIDSIGGKSKVK